MSADADRPADDALPPITPQHYQVLCGLGLGVSFIVQLQQELLIPGLLMLVPGAAAVLLKMRISPVLVLLPVGVGQLLRYTLANRFFPGVRPAVGLFQVPDLVLCAAVLAYVAGHYRLHALWFNILPPDPRRRYRADAAPADQVGKPAPPRRSSGLLTPAELAWFVLQLPLFALLAQGAWYALTPRWRLVELTPRWMQLVVVAWALVVGMFVVGHFFRYWRRLRTDPLTARTALQDVLWQETRGEQRRVNRWLAWWKLKRRRPPSAP